MIKYDPALEQFKDFVNFTNTDPCIWVAYPPGAAGDLIASFINFHYVNTSASFRGMKDTGEVVFMPTDFKHVNKLLGRNEFTIDKEFFAKIVEVLSSKNTNYSLLDQVIFSAHVWEKNNLEKILTAFPNCKIIRILTKSAFERNVTQWLYHYKNNHEKLDLGAITVQDYDTVISDPRILDIYFSDLLNETRFEDTYSKIIQHLNLSGKLIRYDFIQYWINLQADEIKPALSILSKNC